MKGGGFTTGPKAHILPCVFRGTAQPRAGRAPLTSLLIYFGRARAKAKARPLAAPRTVPSPGPSLPAQGRTADAVAGPGRCRRSDSAERGEGGERAAPAAAALTHPPWRRPAEVRSRPAPPRPGPAERRRQPGPPPPRGLGDAAALFPSIIATAPAPLVAMAAPRS